MAGWIKLHRQFMGNGHFHMPDRALKVWLYILMQVSHQDQPRWGIERGSGWISYSMIADVCSEIRDDGTTARMTNKSIAATLKWLEDNGYIRREVSHGKGQKIIVPNYDKYQGEGHSGSLGEQVGEQAGSGIQESGSLGEQVREQPREQVREHIQECKEQKNVKKDTPPPPDIFTADDNPVESLVLLYNQYDPANGGDYQRFTARRYSEMAAAMQAGASYELIATVITEMAATARGPWEIRREAVKRARGDQPGVSKGDAGNRATGAGGREGARKRVEQDKYAAFFAGGVSSGD